MSVWKLDETLLIFCILNFSFKNDCLRRNIKHSTVFHHQMKHLEGRQKYSAARRIFHSLLGVSSGDETLRLMFDILRQKLSLSKWGRVHISCENEFYCMRMKSHFHIKGWALNLVLIQRPGVTRKWLLVWSGKTNLASRVSPPRAPVLSCAHYFQAPAEQDKERLLPFLTFAQMFTNKETSRVCTGENLEG